VYEVALKCGVDSGEVANEWIAFSTENDHCLLTSDNIDKWDTKVWLYNCSAHLNVFFDIIYVVNKFSEAQEKD